MLLALAMWGCAPVPADHACDLSGPHVVVATTDFVGGALAAVTVDDSGDACVADRLVSIGGDAVVRSTDRRVWVLERTGGSTLTAYDPGAYQQPVVEVVVAPGGNAHDLVRYDDQLFVSLYDEARIAVLDGDGDPVGEVDLSPYADADGLPEVDRLVVTDVGLFAALQRLDRDSGWVGTEGYVVRIDPADLSVETLWSTGPNPRLAAHPDGERLVALTGHYFAPDGALEVVDPVDDAVDPLLVEEELGFDLGSSAGSVVVGTAFEEGGDSVLAGWDADGVRVLQEGAAWYVDAVSTPLGVVVATRRGWGGQGAGELLLVDDEGVSWLADGFALDPFAVAFVE